MSSQVASRLLSEVAQYYSAKLLEHGPTSRGVDWNGPESHQLRHRQFLRLLADIPDASIIDLGCGFGDFLSFLRRAGFRGPFTGYDVAPEMIEKARELHSDHGGQSWHVGATPEGVFDFAIASGIFNVKGNTPDEDWADYINRTLDVLAQASRIGFGFNILSLSSDPERRRPHLYYANPAGMLDHCLSRYGRSVALLQDYGLYEFTVLVRHGQVDAPGRSQP
ncbi:class I SAM-dependent methyltransferase [Bradyrhizobium sp. ISRA443]|uniref:class I SAM-dependent methyltransferase n=1 Tax=unclassified Bradyrhizobium TaxID=2631580 RepID=UPI00247A2F1B|nr:MULTISPECIES: class I SAM-dependent methyltransferase [unclassified Bradyrhizobium]WGR92936.1 class I SAM-dependent methyltransferase [Bradyrhizobium sp. ISRA435]WGR97430.1 class I SAM-dependent methyltransferase [Bradyrhizobium sp. ISRA436]WGS04318.1 class I SAM-dependent methyltransferase [Bradyrhizobium sp. ISRA437]WGS11202.1 class I SAM-dependent methyltransferase [Bradyrhizobium sp. ISRA443]